MTNRVLFDPASDKPFRKRDAELLEKALGCMGENPARAAGMYGLRALSAALYLGPCAHGIFRSAFPRGPGFAETFIKWQSIVIQAFIALALVPGLVRLTREERGWNIAVAAAWYVLFYATVTYSARFKAAAWPVFVLCGAAGAGWLRSALQEKTRDRMIAAAWVAAVIALFAAFPWLSGPAFPGPGRTGSEMQDEREKKDDAVRVFMINLAGNYERAGRPELLEKELMPFIMKRLDSVSKDSLDEAKSFFENKGMDRAAGVFREMASQKADKNPPPHNAR